MFFQRVIEVVPKTTAKANTFHQRDVTLAMLSPLVEVVVVVENLSVTIAIPEPDRDYTTLLLITARLVLRLRVARITGRRYNSNSILDEQTVITTRHRLRCLLMQHRVLRPLTQVIIIYSLMVILFID